MPNNLNDTPLTPEITADNLLKVAVVKELMETASTLAECDEEWAEGFDPDTGKYVKDKELEVVYILTPTGLFAYTGPDFDHDVYIVVDDQWVFDGHL